MPLPLPNLDDRRFDDLVAELGERLLRQVPELSQIAPGDPVFALVDLFAWLTETIIYRANLIPYRQRRAFLNLLQIPLRPARPARGVVCIDAAAAGRELPPLLPPDSPLEAGRLPFSTVGELQPTPLELRLMVKSRLDKRRLLAEGITLAQLTAQYGVEPAAFRPVQLLPGKDRLSAEQTVDGALYLAVCSLKQPQQPDRDALLQLLAGVVLNVGVGPESEAEGEVAGAETPRRLVWELAWWRRPEQSDQVEYLRLEVVADSSRGGRRLGVVRLRLPRNADRLTLPAPFDPRFAGFRDTPPEPPADLAPGRLLFWLRVRCPDDAVSFGYLGLNAVEVEGAGTVRALNVGVGTGEPDQVVSLPADLQEGSLRLELQEGGELVPWQEVSHFAGSGPGDRVYLVEAADGLARFGDGIRGRRPGPGSLIRVAYCRYGGGAAGNLPPGSITGAGAGLKVRHEWPTRGGTDRERIEDAERRIPAFLRHRERAVTAEDFALLALEYPVRPVARADAVAGFFPGVNLGTVRRDVPGVVSVFVLPPARPALGGAPRPTAGMIRELHEYLGSRTLLGTELYVLSPQYQPIAVSLSAEAADPATEAVTFRGVEQALTEYLWPLSPYGLRGSGWPLGRSVEINELRTRAGRVEGVEAVNGVRLFFQDTVTLEWRELTGRQDLELRDYQLPELIGVTVAAGEGTPPPPEGIGEGTGGGTTAAGAGQGAAVPVPVIPDVC